MAVGTRGILRVADRTRPAADSRVAADTPPAAGDIPAAVPGNRPAADNPRLARMGNSCYLGF